MRPSIGKECVFSDCALLYIYTTFNVAFRLILMSGVGLQWNNLHLPVNINEKFTMAHVFIMMAVDIIYFSIITWYFDALLPGDFGMPQPFYFPFTVK